MDTAPSTIPVHSNRSGVRGALVVDAVLWLAAVAASVNRALYSDDEWGGSYALFSVLVLVAAAATTLAIALVLAAAVLAVLVRRSSGTPITIRSATQPA